MSLWVLDTDHVTLLQQIHPLVVRRVATINYGELAVTVVTAEEQMRGWLNVIRQASQSSQSDRLIWAYTGLRDALHYLNSFNLLNFDQAAYTRYTELRRQKVRIGTQDLRIAAIVLSVNGILVTRNQRDFAQVPGLILEDWTIP